MFFQPYSNLVGRKVRLYPAWQFHFSFLQNCDLCRGGSNDALSMLLPADAFHLVLRNSYYCAVANLHFPHNLIEVTVLKERKVELPGWVQAYFRPTKFEYGWKNILQQTKEKDTACQLCKRRRPVISFIRITCTITIFVAKQI
jgi:hypothetical protein